MSSAYIPIFLILLSTGLLLGFIYWIHCKQKIKEEKKRISDAKDRKLKKADVVASGLLAITATGSAAAAFSNDDDFLFLDQLIADMNQQHIDTHNELVDFILDQFTEERIDSLFSNISSGFPEIYGCESMFTDHDVFNHFDNDINMGMMDDSFSSFDNSFDDKY